MCWLGILTFNMILYWFDTPNTNRFLFRLVSPERGREGTHLRGAPKPEQLLHNVGWPLTPTNQTLFKKMVWLNIIIKRLMMYLCSVKYDIFSSFPIWVKSFFSWPTFGLFANSSLFLLQKSSDSSLRFFAWFLMPVQFQSFHWFVDQYRLANDTHWLWKEDITENKMKFNIRFKCTSSAAGCFLKKGIQTCWLWTHQGRTITLVVSGIKYYEARSWVKGTETWRGTETQCIDCGSGRALLTSSFLGAGLASLWEMLAYGNIWIWQRMAYTWRFKK